MRQPTNPKIRAARREDGAQPEVTWLEATQERNVPLIAPEISGMGMGMGMGRLRTSDLYRGGIRCGFA
jgi:hypothetical protein